MRRLVLMTAGFLFAAMLAMTAAAGPEKKPDAPPKGFVKMKVAGVVPGREGNAVVLSDEKESVHLPIFIGDAEAFAIQMRLDRRRFQRPLTHDLLDSVMRELGGRLVKIHVDDLKGNTFVGTVFMSQQGRLIEIDARPSDAIALAVGNRVPIYVSSKVLDRAGVRKEKSDGGDKPSPDKLLEDILKSDREEHTL